MASFLSTLFGGGAERDAANRNRAVLNDYQTKGLGYLDDGLARSTGALNAGYDAASAAYVPLMDLGKKYGAATTLGLDAYGVNGAAGNHRARQAFQAGPGYQFALDQGQQAVERRRAIGGGWNSGNTDIDLLKYAQGLADQEFNAWRNGLAGLAGPELAATSVAAAGAANAAAGRGTSLANLHAGDASNRVGLTGNVASGNMAANNLEAQGRAQGARNVFNGVMNGALSLAQLGGGFGFGGGGGSSPVGAYNHGGVAVPYFG